MVVFWLSLLRYLPFAENGIQRAPIHYIRCDSFRKLDVKVTEIINAADALFKWLLLWSQNHQCETFLTVYVCLICSSKYLPAEVLASLSTTCLCVCALALTHLTLRLHFYDPLSCSTGNLPWVLTDLSSCSVNRRCLYHSCGGGTLRRIRITWGWPAVFQDSHYVLPSKLKHHWLYRKTSLKFMSSKIPVSFCIAEFKTTALWKWPCAVYLTCDLRYPAGILLLCVFVGPVHSSCLLCKQQNVWNLCGRNQ